MIQIKKNNLKLKNKIFLKSSLGYIQLFFIDKIFILPNDIQIYKKNKFIFFKTSLGLLSLQLITNSFFFIKKNKLLLTCNIKNKKSIINLYTKLIKIKIKGIFQGFKLTLVLKGIGFKSVIEKNVLILKLGFSHNIIIPIPDNIKIINHVTIHVDRSYCPSRFGLCRSKG